MSYHVLCRAGMSDNEDTLFGGEAVHALPLGRERVASITSRGRISSPPTDF